MSFYNLLRDIQPQAGAAKGLGGKFWLNGSTLTSNGSTAIACSAMSICIRSVLSISRIAIRATNKSMIAN
jgi:hypothetical protein